MAAFNFPRARAPHRLRGSSPRVPRKYTVSPAKKHSTVAPPAPAPVPVASTSTPPYQQVALPAYKHNSMKVSVVTSTYNRPEIFYRTLYSLYRQKADNYEVLVSIDDDESHLSKTMEVVNEFIAKGMPIKYFETYKYKRGKGFSCPSYPYNVGIRNATGDVIILHGSDILDVTDTINQHRYAHGSSARYVIFSTVHAITLSVQNQMDNFNWKSNPSCLLFKGSCYKMFTGRGISYTNAYAIEDAAVPYHFLCSIRREHLTHIRGFDEDFYGYMPSADDDLANRLSRYGCEFVFDPRILAIHQFHKCPEKISSNTFAKHNPHVSSGYTLFRQRSNCAGIVRNVGHEWGQYPRDMKNLPDMSGDK